MKIFKFAAVLALCFAIPVFADAPVVAGVGDTVVSPTAVTVTQVFGGVLMAMATFLFGMLSKFVNAKAEESIVAKTLAILTSFIQSVVADIDVTLRPKLEAALVDGVLTQVEKDELRKTALSIVLTKLPDSVLTVARGIFGAGLETKILGLIESHVTALHSAKASTDLAVAQTEKIAPVPQ